MERLKPLFCRIPADVLTATYLLPVTAQLLDVEPENLVFVIHDKSTVSKKGSSDQKLVCAS